MSHSIKSLITSAFFSACLFISVDGFTQEAGAAAMSSQFGIKGGLNLANLYVDNVQDQNVKAGVVVGFYAKLPLSKGVSLQPELLYSNKGAQLTYSNIIQGQGVYRFNLNYVELPITFVFNIVKNFNIHAGAYTGYLASANVKNVQEGTIIGITELNESDFNRFDFGLAGGLGVDIGKFGIGARYNYGLNEVGKAGTLAGELTKNSRNSTLSFYLSFGF